MVVCAVMNDIMCGIYSGLLKIICSVHSIHTSVAEEGWVGAQGGGLRMCLNREGWSLRGV